VVPIVSHPDFFIFTFTKAKVLVSVLADKAMFMWTRAISEAKIMCPIIFMEFPPHSLLPVVVLISHFFSFLSLLLRKLHQKKAASMAMSPIVLSHRIGWADGPDRVSLGYFVKKILDL